jgi:hypothetical protein
VIKATRKPSTTVDEPSTTVGWRAIPEGTVAIVVSAQDDESLEDAEAMAVDMLTAMAAGEMPKCLIITVSGEDTVAALDEDDMLAEGWVRAPAAD